MEKLNLPARFSKRLILIIAAIFVLIIVGIILSLLLNKNTVRVQQDSDKNNNINKNSDVNIGQPDYFNYGNYNIIEEKDFDLDKDEKEEKIVYYSEDAKGSSGKLDFGNLHVAILRSHIDGSAEKYKKVWEKELKNSHADLSNQKDSYVEIYDRGANTPKLKIAADSVFSSEAIEYTMVAFNKTANQFKEIEFLDYGSREASNTIGGFRDYISFQDHSDGNAIIKETLEATSTGGEYFYEWDQARFAYISTNPEDIKLKEDLKNAKTFSNAEAGFSFEYPQEDSIKKCDKDMCGNVDDFYIESPDHTWLYVSKARNAKSQDLEKYLAEEYNYNELLFNKKINKYRMEILEPKDPQHDSYYGKFGELGSGIEYNLFITGNKDWVLYFFHDQEHQVNRDAVKMAKETIRFIKK